MIEQLPHDLLPMLAEDKDVKLGRLEPARPAVSSSASTRCRSRSTIRRSARRSLYALDQEDYLKADDRRSAIVSSECKSLFICGSPCSRPRAGRLLKPNFDKAQALLKEAGYDGTPIVLMQSTDLPVLDQPRAGGQVAAREGRLQGRHAVDGLADAGHAPHQEGSAGRRAAGTSFHHLLGVGRHPRPGLDQLPQSRAATRRGSAGRATPRSRSCATPSPSETDPAKAEGAGRSGAGCAPSSNRRSTAGSASGTARAHRARTSSGMAEGAGRSRDVERRKGLILMHPRVPAILAGTAASFGDSCSISSLAAGRHHPRLAVVAVFVFLMLRLTPGDPGRDHRRRQCQRRPDRADPQKLGLDQPIWQQFVIWIGDIAARRFRRELLLQEDRRRADREQRSSRPSRCRSAP